jgi:hypothetical protein
VAQVVAYCGLSDQSLPLSYGALVRFLAVGARRPYAKAGSLLPTTAQVKFRYVICIICHYGHPFSWHWIEAAPTFGPMHCFQPHGPATGWQESVLFTTVGSSPGSFTSQVHSFRARSVHPGLFNTKASDTTAVTESAECYSSAAADVEDLSGAGELTSFAQRSEQTSALDARSPPSVSPRSAEKRPGTCNNEDAAAEKFYAVEGVVSRLALRDWKAPPGRWKMPGAAG